MKIPGVYTPITKEKIEEPKDPVAINDAELVPCNWDIKENKDGSIFHALKSVDGHNIYLHWYPNQSSLPDK